MKRDHHRRSRCREHKTCQVAALAAVVVAFVAVGLAIFWRAKVTTKKSEDAMPQPAAHSAAVLRRWQDEAVANCAPLYYQNFFLKEGHDASNRNATATFVSFGGKYYLATCGHVVDLLETMREEKVIEHPTLGFFFDKTFTPLSHFTAEGLKHDFRRVQGVDIAILDISELWPMLQAVGKVAIEVDEERHREPRWAKAQMMASAGYPEHHKRNAIRGDGTERVFGTAPFIVADKRGDIDRHNELVVMKSTLEKPHGWYFSGISGGPMYVIQDELLIPVGIAIAGWPRQPEEEPKGSLTDKDIVIQGQTLTPEFFGRWLIATGLAS